MAVDHPEWYFGIVGERDGEVVGIKCACVMPCFYSDNKVCWDQATYVTPKARSFALLYKMVQAYKQWAISVGARQAYLGATSQPGNPRIATLFTRLGFQPAGTLHVMEIDNGQGWRRRQRVRDDADAARTAGAAETAA
jgi:GNAT superfamily N-acetyltransferase